MIENILLFRGKNFDSNFFYFSNVDIDYSFYLKLEDEKYLIVSPLNREVAEQTFNGTVISSNNFSEEIVKLAKGKTLHADFRALPTKFYLELNGKVNLKNASDYFYELRRKKSREEEEKIKRAVKLTKKILNKINVFDFKDEEALKNELISLAYKNRASPAYEPIVSSGDNTNFPHVKPKVNIIRDFVLVDFGVRLNYYCADITRVFFEKERGKEFEYYEKLKRIFYSVIENFNFENSKELSEYIEKLFKKESIKLPPHSFGHGIGLDVHEFPRISKNYSDSLVDSIFTLEPATYLTSFGLRFEEVLKYDGSKIKVF